MQVGNGHGPHTTAPSALMSWLPPLAAVFSLHVLGIARGKGYNGGQARPAFLTVVSGSSSVIQGISKMWTSVSRVTAWRGDA